MKIKNMDNKSLLKRTEELRKIEKKATTEILDHIQEIGRRKLYCDLGHASLFDYLIKHLHYSESQAARRIAAARLVTNNDTARKKIETGALTLTTASNLSRFFEKEKIEKPKQIEIIDRASGLSKRECEKLILSESKEAKNLPREHVKLIDSETTRIYLNASEELMKKIDKVKEHLGPISYEEILTRLCDNYITQKEKYWRLRQKKTGKTTGRTISLQVKREVRTRAGEQCEWSDPVSNKRCQCRMRLEFDHIRPFAQGGDNSLNNIRLLCRNHNLRAAIKVYGQTKMDRYINSS